MKLFISTTITILGVGLFGGCGVMAGEDIVIGFPGMLIVRATGTASGTNMQTFTGALGGATADAITQTGDSSRPFEVAGSTFTDFSSAAQRSCDNQHNACANLANSDKSSGLTVGDCDTQETSCLAAQNNVVVATSAGPEATATETATETVQSSAATSTVSANQTVKSADAEFFYICDV